MFEKAQELDLTYDALCVDEVVEGVGNLAHSSSRFPSRRFLSELPSLFDSYQAFHAFPLPFRRREEGKCEVTIDA